MLKVILFSLITCAVHSVNAQVQTQVIGDSVFVHSNTGKGELILQNSTDSVNGFLFNKGAGRTEFKKALIKINDSTYLVGTDTLHMNNTGGAQTTTLQNAFDNASTANPQINSHSQGFEIDSVGIFSVNSYGSTGESILMNNTLFSGHGTANNSYFSTSVTTKQDDSTYATLQTQGPLGNQNFQVFSNYQLFSGNDNFGNPKAKVVFQSPEILTSPPPYIAAFDGDTLKKVAYPVGGGVTPSLDAVTAVGNTSGVDIEVNYVTVGRGKGTNGNSTVVGAFALPFNTTGDQNTIIGSGASENSTTAGFNTVVGAQALQTNIASNYNVAVGVNSMNSHNSGDNNTAIGSNSMAGLSGTNNTAIGAYSFNTLSNFTNTTAIGYNSVPTASNQIMLGSNAITQTVLRGSLKAFNYGSGTFTGTPAYNLAIDASGNVIEAAIGSGSYTPPLATTNSTGVISVGQGLIIDSAGKLSTSTALLKPGSVPYAGPDGSLIQDTSGLVYDGNNLQVGHSGFYNTTGLSLNGGRGQLAASGFGLTIGTNGGQPMDASKSISFYNSSSLYASMSMRSASDSTLRFLSSMEFVPAVTDKYNLGALANQWDTVFAKQLYINGSLFTGGITLTTAGTSGPATLSGSSLNIPNYGSVGGNSWNVTGNSGTTDSNFIGTTDNKSLLFKTNKVLSGWIDVVNRNTTLGYSSLAVNTPTGGSYGRYNSAFGYDALQLNTTGYNNMGFGGVSLYNNSTGWDNAAIGVASLFSNSSGYGNVAIGRDAMRYNTIGYNNVGIGITALDYNSTGHGNTAIGWAAIWNNGVHSNNIGIGVNAGAGHNTEDNTMYISDSTHHMYFKLDSAIGTAPSIIGKDANGYWHVYQAPSGGNVVETTLVDSTVTLSLGTITVSDTRIKTGAKIFVTCNTPSGTQGFLSAPASGIVDRTSFVINSTSATDNSTVNYQIINP